MGDVPDPGEIAVRASGKTTIHLFRTEIVLALHFVPCDVEEKVVPIRTGPSLKDFEIDEDYVPF
jgi:hypothetical protein